MKRNQFLCVLATVLFMLVMGGRSWAEDPKEPEQGAVQPALTLWQLTNQTKTQMMSYLFQTENGELVVLDGGNRGDAEYLLKMIHEVRPDGHVTAWILSHVHSDHYGALSELLTKNATDFSVETLYYAFPPLDVLDRIEPNGKKYRDKQLPVIMESLPATVKSVVHPEKDTTFQVDNITFTAMNSFCSDYEGYTRGVNDSTVCWRVDTGKTSLLFLGDLGERGCAWLLESQSPERLRCDYTQMAHHGQWALSFEQYEILQPKRCLWPTTDWLWDNDAGKGPGTGPYEVRQTAEWMEKLGALEHYYAKDGTIRLEIP